MSNRYFINSLERCFHILETIAKSGRGLTLSEVAEFCQLNKTATNRFLYTLCSLGYLRRDGNKRYFLNSKIFELASGFLDSSKIRSISKPHIDELFRELDYSVDLVVLEDQNILFIYSKDSPKFLKFDVSKLPVHCTASGKVLIAGHTDRELKIFIKGLELKTFTKHTIISKKSLWDEIMQTRKRGYGICDRELSMDLYSIAVPLIDDNRKVVGAVSVTIPTLHKNAELLRMITDKLLRKGKSISEILGYKREYPNF